MRIDGKPDIGDYTNLLEQRAEARRHVLIPILLPILLDFEGLCDLD